jgi:hypothetical protein
MATDLYHRTMDFDYGDGERCELMQRVWRGTPWMVDTYTGGYSASLRPVAPADSASRPTSTLMHRAGRNSRALVLKPNTRT